MAYKGLQGLTISLTFAIFSAALGMLQVGYNYGSICKYDNIVKFMEDVYKSRYGDDVSWYFEDYLFRWILFTFAIGGMLGSFSGGWIANRFGRKCGLLLCNAFGITGACLMGFAKVSQSHEMFFLGRFIIGINCGVNTTLVPMYISEIAPLNLRGALGTVNQLAMLIGLFLSQVLGIEDILGTNERWPVIVGLAICPAILQLILLPACPESPRYLFITKQREEEARKALRKLRASSTVEEDIEEMRAEKLTQHSERHISSMELICSPTLRTPLIISIVLQLSQQFSGINVISYYFGVLYFDSTQNWYAEYGNIINVAKYIVIMLISIPLMELIGRRTLHLCGLGGMFIISVYMTISFLTMKFFDNIREIFHWVSYWPMLGFIIFYAIGPGSIPCMITAELFTQGPRSSAMAIAALVNWMATCIVLIGFNYMRNALESYIFLPFTIMLAIFWIFTYKMLPETKNKTFKEISELFRHGNGLEIVALERLVSKE